MRSELDSIYKQYIQDVYRYLLSLSGDHHTAEDLVQDTFYRAYLYLEGIGEEKVKPWLLRVAYNAFIDYTRKRRRSVPKDDAWLQRELTDYCTPEQWVLQQERIAELRQKVELLPPRQREAVLLVDCYQRTYEEAADIMKVNIGHLKVLLFRGRQRLRNSRKGDNDDE
ncbi:sigma-70 family RNA polymerase sigma factor [Paenibacillus sp. SYP-B4298]|uniref:sigma-70 family RNA polymerase sigma factor n=1 Tax=Paenibacillus sp. SYP-B4298 TaxID=2996034 RepID=UPI0022DE4D83|nr:sigma-70 family RNA polymerase sigma factor [Paenibacillus sp. SYP-B4298]